MENNSTCEKGKKEGNDKIKPVQPYGPCQLAQERGIWHWKIKRSNLPTQCFTRKMHRRKIEDLKPILNFEEAIFGALFSTGK